MITGTNIHTNSFNNFDDLFYNESLDGITAAITVAKDPETANKYDLITEDDIPSNYYKMCYTHSHEIESAKIILVVKSMNLRKKTINLLVPDAHLKELLIGPYGGNVRELAYLLDAKYVYIESKTGDPQPFINFFNKHTSDGFTAVLPLGRRNTHSEEDFFFGYIPNEYIRISTIFNGSFFGIREAFFIKQFDAHHQVVKLKIPEKFQFLYEDKYAEGFKRIAQKLNARSIELI